MRVDEAIVEKVRTSVDIVDIVGEYVQLKKQGRNYFGLCPFHSEKSPSFSVSPEKQIFHCFGCGVGGNVYTFLMEIEGYTFPEAVYHLGEKVGISVPQNEKNTSDHHQKDDRLYHGMELLTKFYHYLLTETPYGKSAMQYLTKRGFNKETIDRFQIGYAPSSWETATRFLEKRGVPLKELVNIGMLSVREFDGKVFDRFRHRVMFPITDMKGRTVAFAGRVLDDQKPKYLNSPESNIFHKGRLLFGYHFARQAIKKKNEVVLFEGYADVIKAYQAGVDNGVASMGTSLTDEQAGILTRNAEKIIICYDSDNAGTEAAFRAAEMLNGYNRTIKIARMPEGLDPDEYIQRFGDDAFRHNVLGASLTVMAFKMQYLRRKRNMNDEGDRLKYIETVLYEISQLPQAVERDHYLRQLSEEFSISLEALKQQQYQIYRSLKNKSKINHQESRVKVLPKNHTLLPAYQMAERQILAHMMRDADLAFEIREQIGAGFNSDIHEALAAHLYAYYEGERTPDVAAFIQRLDDRELKAAATEIAMMEISTNASAQEIEDCIKMIKQHKLEEHIRLKEIERKEAERANDLEKATEILAEIILMKKGLGRN
ncbi:MAG: DNA primase [Tuberibacillus sp.]